MSHFTVTVVVPKDKAITDGDIDDEAIAAYVQRVLAPYDEGLEAPARREHEVVSPDGWLTSYAVKNGVDPTNLTALAELLNTDEEGWGVDEDGLYRTTTYNPKSKWDWYSVGGRWMGYFKAKPGVKFATGRPGVFDNEAKPGFADVIRKDDVDWEGMAYDMAEDARTWFRQCQEQGRPVSIMRADEQVTEEEYVAGTSTWPRTA